MYKLFNYLTHLFDLLLIFAPLLLFMDNGNELFIYVFYLIYLPDLILQFIKKKFESKKSITPKHVEKKVEYLEIP